MTLNDLERRNSPYFVFFSSNSIALQADYVTVVEEWRETYNVLKYCLPVPVFRHWRKLTHPAVRSLCDSWTFCFIQIFTRWLPTIQTPILCRISEISRHKVGEIMCSFGAKKTDICSVARPMLTTLQDRVLKAKVYCLPHIWLSCFLVKKHLTMHFPAVIFCTILTLL